MALKLEADKLSVDYCVLSIPQEKLYCEITLGIYILDVKILTALDNIRITT